MSDQNIAETPRQRGRRQRILEAAAEVFLVQGFKRTNLDDVIAKAGCSKQTLYRYFGNKEKLFTAFIENEAHKASQMLVLDDSDLSSYQNTLRQFSINYINTYLSAKGRALVRISVEQANFLPEVAQIFLEKGPGRTYMMVGEYFNKLVEVGYFQLDDGFQAAEVFIGMLRGEIFLRAVLLPEYHPTEMELEQHIELVISLLFNGCSGNG